MRKATGICSYTGRGKKRWQSQKIPTRTQKSKEIDERTIDQNERTSETMENRAVDIREKIHKKKKEKKRKVKNKRHDSPLLNDQPSSQSVNRTRHHINGKKNGDEAKLYAVDY